MTSEDTSKSTCSPEAVFGVSPPVLPDGQTTNPSGPRLAPASRSRKPARDSVTMTQGTCGRTWFDSSMTAVATDTRRLASWESKLAGRLASIGSTECELIWRHEDTKLGWSRSRLARWTPPTSETESTGSPWTTPCASETGNRQGKYPQGGTSLNTQMLHSHWPTPTVADVQGGRKTRSGERSDEPLLNGLMTWSTPRASDGEKGGPNQSFGAGGQPLPAQMHQASPWVTPSTRDWKDTPGMATERDDGRSRLDQLPRQMAATEAATWPTPTSLSGGSETSNPPGNSRSMNKTLEMLYGPDRGMSRTGPTPNGSSATTEKRGAPNPVFACWLMGFPDAWISGALRAMQSRPSLRRKSSPRSVKRSVGLIQASVTSEDE